MTTRRNALIAAGGLLSGYGLKSTGVTTALAQTSDYKVETDIPYLNYGSGTLNLDVYHPTNTEDYPVFLFIHGGGWTSGDKSNVGADTHGNMAQEFASRGFGLVSANYRLAPDYTYPTAPHDIVMALNWIYNHRLEYGWDPKRVLIGGFSAGGHLSALVGSAAQLYGFKNGCPDFTPVNGVIAIDGAYNPDGNTHSGLTDFFGDTYSAITSTWEEGSPTTHITEDHAPTLIMHAQDDTTLSYDPQALDYRDAVQSAGVPYEFVNPESGGHTFYREGDWQTKSVDKWENFITKHV